MTGYFRVLLRWAVEPYRGWLFGGLGDAMWARNGRKLGLAGFFGALFAWAATPFGLGRLGELTQSRHGIRRLSGGLAMTMVAATAMALNSGPAFNDHRDESSHSLLMSSLTAGGSGNAETGDQAGAPTGGASEGAADQGGGNGGGGAGAQPPARPDFNLPGPPDGGMVVLASGTSVPGGPLTLPPSALDPPAEAPGAPDAEGGGSGADGYGFGFGGGSGGGGFGGGGIGGFGGGTTTASNGGVPGNGGGTGSPPGGGIVLVSTGGGTGGGGKLCSMVADLCLPPPGGFPPQGSPPRFDLTLPFVDPGPDGGPDQAPGGANGPFGFGPPSGGNTVTAVPEPAAWLMMIAGFFGIGGALRARRRHRAANAA